MPVPYISKKGNTMNKATDIVVLGGGPGGYAAAFRAADLGKKVILIEREKYLGGTCLNIGCIPSKYYLHTAKVMRAVRDLENQGIKYPVPEINFAQLVDSKNKLVHKLDAGLDMLAKHRKVEVIHGSGKFISPKQILVNDQTIDFEHAVIAAGSEITHLKFMPSDPRIIDSAQALNFPYQTGDMLIIGAGSIGLEMATIYSALGVKVTLVDIVEQIFPVVDSDIVAPLYRRLQKQCKKILLQTTVEKVVAKPEGLFVTFSGEDKSEHKFDFILLAVGRTANGKLIGAEAAGVKVNDRGVIQVDNQLRTNVSHIFAVGDITGCPMLAHKASAQGKIAAEVIHGDKHFFDAPHVPAVCYTDPEIAVVGLTEQEAKQKNINYGKGVFHWLASGRALGEGHNDGITKLLFDNANQQLIGAAIVGANAGDLISAAALAITMNCTAEEIALTIHPHPTFSETLMMAAEVYLGTAVDLINRS